MRRSHPEWHYCCEQRQSLTSGEPSSLFPGLTEALGAGSDTPLVVTKVFLNAMDVHTYFLDIPVGRDRVHYANQRLVQGKAQLVSSGEVLGPNLGSKAVTS